MISPLYWQFSLLCVLAPGLLYLIWMLSRYWRGQVDFRWPHLARKCLRTPIYPLIVIQASMRGVVRSLRGEEDDRESNRAKQYKLMEILGELFSNSRTFS